MGKLRGSRQRGVFIWFGKGVSGKDDETGAKLISLDNLLHNRRDWSFPAGGRLPISAFDDRAANLYNALCITPEPR